MDQVLFTFGIPLLLALVCLEEAVARRRGRSVHRLEETVTNISLALYAALSGLFIRGLVLGGYAWVYATLSPATWDPGLPGTWLLAIVLVDLAYYWWHRASHRIALLWATHAVHHQAQHYNLSAALRYGALARLTALPFYGVVALAGIPPVVFLAVDLATSFFTLFVHTRLVRRLGPLEAVLVTPSHHRVHHGINSAFVDRNYGGVFIVWDRLFGTFAAEGDEEPVYGTVTPFVRWDPIQANLAPFQALLERMRQCPRVRDRLHTLWMPPGWRPLGRARPVQRVARGARPTGVRAGPRAVLNALTGELALIAVAGVLLSHASALSGPVIAAAAAGVVLVAQGIARLLEGAREPDSPCRTPALLPGTGTGSPPAVSEGCAASGRGGLRDGATRDLS